MHEDPHFEYFYYEAENIEDIAKRWHEYNETQCQILYAISLHYTLCV